MRFVPFYNKTLLLIIICFILGYSFYSFYFFNSIKINNEEEEGEEEDTNRSIFSNIYYSSELHIPGKFRLSNLLDHHMVLQRGEPASIWGWCGEKDSICKVNVLFKEETFSAKILDFQLVNPKSTFIQKKWIVSLPPTKEGGPYSIYIKDFYNSGLKLTDVYFGDVFLCSGQSNMLFTVGQTFSEREKEKEENYDYPLIRLLSIGRHESFELSNDIIVPELSWSIASEYNIRKKNDPWGYFSAVCWYYGQSLYEEIGVPIGLISATVNGSPLQAWVPSEINTFCPPSNNEPMDCCPTQDNVIWNAVINPLLDMKISAIIFYQGESNMYGTNFYTCAIEKFISFWCKSFGNDNLPFFIVEIQPLFYKHPFIEEFREIQKNIVKTLPNVEIISTIDLGDYNSPFGFLHPRLKEKIGERLKDCALYIIYNYDIYPFGATLKDIVISQITDYYKIDVIFNENTVGNSGIILKDYNCPDTDFQLETYPLSEFCCGFEVHFTDNTIIQCDNYIEKTSFNTITITLPDKRIISKITYGYCGWPKSLVYNSYNYPTSPFVYSL